MQKIIPFEKELVFRTMIGEITNISLEHTLSFAEDKAVHGDFIISGRYKMTEASQIEEDFEYRIPVDIEIAEHWDISDATINIDDFNYEVINDDVLKVNIELLLDNIEKKSEDVIEVLDEVPKVQDIVLEEENTVREDETDDKAEVAADQRDDEKKIVVDEVLSTEDNPKSQTPDLFTMFQDEDETFSTYSVYIIRENDTLEEIITRYQTSREELANYNNLDDIALGTKLIIPRHITKDVQNT